MVCWSLHLLYLFSESIEIGWEAVEMENGSRDVIRFVLKEKEQSDSLRVFEPATSQAPAGRCQYTSTAIKEWSCNVPFESLRFAKDIQRVTNAKQVSESYWTPLRLVKIINVWMFFSPVSELDRKRNFTLRLILITTFVGDRKIC